MAKIFLSVKKLRKGGKRRSPQGFGRHLSELMSPMLNVVLPLTLRSISKKSLFATAELEVFHFIYLVSVKINSPNMMSLYLPQ
jgi:hypothetical protein